MYILVIFLCCLLFWCIQFHWKKRRLYKLSWKIPGVTGLPFIGGAYLFFWKDAAEIAKRFMQMFDDYPEFSKIWLGKHLYFLITKPEYLEIVLNSPAALDKLEIYNFTYCILGNGLLTSPAKMWKRHRKIIAPSLNQKILNEYVGTICEQCNTLINILRKKCTEGEINHYLYITDCALDIVCETIFGIPINAQHNSTRYGHLMDRLFETVFLRVFRYFYHFEFVFRWTKEFQDQIEISDEFKNVSREIIEKKIEQIRGQVQLEDDKKKPLLDTIVEKFLTGEFTRDELENEVATFLLAGTDTNSTSASFALLLLGMHQNIQQKIYEEVIDVLGPDRMVTLEDLPKLKYTERAIKESLRVFPGAPFSGRLVEEDISLGDLIIPKGSNISVGYLHLHRNEKYWRDPFKFDPDRFLPENSLNRHPYTWLPFSGGPRNCIGMKYGMMVMKIMIAMVIRKFKVTSSVKSIQDIELTANIVLKPKNGFSLGFEPR